MISNKEDEANAEYEKNCEADFKAVNKLADSIFPRLFGYPLNEFVITCNPNTELPLMSKEETIKFLIAHEAWDDLATFLRDDQS